MNWSPRRLLATAVVVATAALQPVAADAAYSGLVVFGDSLSDAGSNATLGLYAPGQVVTDNSYVATSAYAAATYSNGPIWATYLGGLLGLPLNRSWLQGGTDYANGGARMSAPGIGPFGYPFSLKTQSSIYLSSVGGRAPADALYVVAGGGNDARDAIDSIAALDLADPTQANTALSIFADTAQSIVLGLASVVDNLYAAGARNIVVWNLPNLGLVPSAETPYEEAIGTAIASGLNEIIEAYLATKPVTLFDVFDVSSIVASYGSALGLTNVTDACGAAPVGTDCNQYMWWDGIHPTTMAHALIGLVLADQLGAVAARPAGLALSAPVPAEVGAPAAAWLFAAAVAGLGLARGRRRRA
ncbi:MAG: SGNH/GDSL hydrolase family protein [Alphaproteobacteria bacterium]|nr:SGNH/GDSL hydrolase family protein [Alphaproteobacteria bacterium]